MSADGFEEHAQNNADRHKQLRRLKWWLRLTPRRATLHRYPVIGRFAHLLRDRFHLWSFRKSHMRTAYYAGSVLSLLPVMGMQLPLALGLSLLLRCNFMVLGGLQFITNPLTAAPIYYGTYQLGKVTLAAVNPARAQPPSDPQEEIRPEEGAGLASSLADEITAETSAADKPNWHTRVRSALGCLVTGGVLSGLALGVILDVLDSAVRLRLKRRASVAVAVQRG